MHSLPHLTPDTKVQQPRPSSTTNDKAGINSIHPVGLGLLMAAAPGSASLARW